LTEWNCYQETLNNNEARLLLEHVVSIVETRTHETVVAALNSLQKLTGADQLILCQFVVKNDLLYIEQICNHSFKTEWIDTYISNSYAHIDPVLKRAHVLKHAFQWDFTREDYIHNEQHKFIESAMDFGLQSGVTCSLPVPNKTTQQIIVGTLGNVDTSRYGVAKNALTVLLPVFQLSFDIAKEGDASDQPRFTNMEHKVLVWASKGKGVWEISTLLNISQSTVKFHLQNVYKKLNVNNRTYAITKAVKFGLL
jgi:DNA-binding CsgD family transcriptional regulator